MLAGMEATVLSEPSAEERARVLATLVSAFRTDPVERWLYPGDEEYGQHFPVFVAAFGGLAFRLGTAWRLGDCAAVALWLPPHAQLDGERSSRFWWRPWRRRSTLTHFRYWTRWMRHTPGTRIGICHGSL